MLEGEFGASWICLRWRLFLSEAKKMSKDESLFRLVYVSERVESEPCDMELLFKESMAFNLTVNVTGALWFDGHQFAQILEGKKDALGLVFERIIVSKNHTAIDLIDFRGTSNRIYKDWHMACLHKNSTSREIAAKYVGHSDFTLRELPVHTLVEMMTGLEHHRQHPSQ